MLKHYRLNSQRYAAEHCSGSLDQQSNEASSNPPMLRAVDIDHLRSLASSTGRSIESYLVADYSTATVRPYKRYIQIYQDWCAAEGCAAVPANYALLVRFFLFATRQYQGPALLDMISAIQYLHVRQGRFVDARGIRFLMNSYVNLRSPPIRQAAALDIASLRKVVGAIPPGVSGARDRALLVLGFAAALRPCELIGLDVGQRAPGGTGSIISEPSCMRIVLHTSKSDYQRRGIEKLVVRGCDPCPIAAVRDWLRASGIAEGAVFRRVCRSGRVLPARLDARSVSAIVRRRAQAVLSRPKDPEAAAGNSAKSITGYSLRAGFVTSAIEANVDAQSIALHLGWANTSLAIRYARRAEGWDKTLVKLVLNPGHLAAPGRLIARAPDSRQLRIRAFIRAARGSPANPGHGPRASRRTSSVCNVPNRSA